MIRRVVREWLQDQVCDPPVVSTLPVVPPGLSADRERVSKPAPVAPAAPKPAAPAVPSGELVIDPDLLRRIAGLKSATDNVRSVCSGLALMGVGAGLHLPHRLASYLAQLAHESARFRYDRELWGPTPAQRRYEGRRDLGNVHPGDGSRFRGRGPIQITGRANYVEFTTWCRARFPSAPDFVLHPETICTDPWEGVGPIWFWDTRKINRFADRGQQKWITKTINGGHNGLDDRLALYARSGLVLLGRDPADVRGFQRVAGLTVDGDAGPNTRAALHAALKSLPPLA